MAALLCLLLAGRVQLRADTCLGLVNSLSILNRTVAYRMLGYYMPRLVYLFDNCEG